MARTIWTEARGEGETAMVAVGWTLRNRMIRDDTTHVGRAWGGYQHGAAATPEARRIARAILNGAASDPTDGATHFYTPKIMPKKGDSTSGVDVGGGLEAVPGVTKNGRPIESYRPSWTLTFDRRLVAGIPEAAFKFYRQPGSGHGVRRLALIGVASLALGAAVPAPAQDEAMTRVLRTIPPTLEAIHDAAERIAKVECSASECQAVAVVAKAMDIMLDAETTTNGLTKPIPSNRDRIADSRLEAAVLSRPERFAATCEMANGLASRYRQAAGQGDLFVAVGLIELALRIDLHGGRCLPAVLASFPRDPESDAAIGNARLLCVNGWKLGAACSRIAR